MKNKTGSMKARYIILLAAMALLAGCAKELNAPVAVEQGKTVLQVGLPSDSSIPVIDTKTFMGDKDAQNHRKVYWSNGDQISVNRVASHALAELPDSTTSAVFTFDQVLSKPYSIIYPASIVSGQWVELPHVQAYKAGGFADNMLPMCGYSETGTGITLYPMCAIVKISIARAATDPDTDDIVSVRFRGRKSEKVSGMFSVSYDSHRMSAETASGEDLEVKVVKHQAISATDSAVYHIVVPARLYDNGFEVVVQDAAGHVMTKSKSSSAFFDPGHLYSMPKFEFVPTGTEIGVEISSAADLVKFATDFNNGVYADRGDLVATLTQDITFDAESSAAFNATGGIGRKAGEFEAAADNYFFGAFNGASHTISGLTVNVPLFAYTNSDAVIENLNLDNTCSLTVENAVRGVHAPMVGRHKGILRNCTSNASVVINNLADVTTAEQHYGGLVGRNYGGSIDHCVVNGDITAAQAGVTITANQAYIGGIAGTLGNTGDIYYCNFNGNITVSDGTTYGGITAEKKYFYVGGIVGFADDGLIDHCDAASSSITKSIDVRGVLVPAIGGIVGWVKTDVNAQVSNCNNYMSLSFASNGARANTTPARIAGIASRSHADISECNNYGAISTACNSTSLFLGGIAGDCGNISNCTNHASGTIIRSNADQVADQANRYMYIGGISGSLVAAGKIEGCTNHAPMLSNVLGTATNATFDMGGILGGGQSSKVEIKDCVNDAEIKLDNSSTTAAVVSARNALGGIVGNVSTTGSIVSGCTNSGKVWTNNNAGGSYGFIHIGGAVGHVADTCSVKDCVNSGEILCQNPGAAISAYVDLGGIVGCSIAPIIIEGTTADAVLNSGAVTVAQASTIIYARDTQGGILGYGKGNDTKIKNCKNTAKIYCNLKGSASANRSSYTGGIVGLLASMSYTSNAPSGLGAVGGVEIDGCNSLGEVNVANYSNKAGNKNSPFGGGIVGLVSGKSDSKAYIHNCTVGSQTVYAYRGVSGGLIGYANMSTIKDNIVAANMSGTNATVNGAGGIVGRLFDSSLENCTFTGMIAKAKNIGGLVYTMSEQTTGSTITGCKVNGATLTTGTDASATAAAVLVSITDAKTNTITNCGVKGTIDGVAITLESNMLTTKGGDGTTVSGTYLLD